VFLVDDTHCPVPHFTTTASDFTTSFLKNPNAMLRPTVDRVEMPSESLT
jgi:hypothetical protein